MNVRRSYFGTATSLSVALALTLMGGCIASSGGSKNNQDDDINAPSDSVSATDIASDTQPNLPEIDAVADAGPSDSTATEEDLEVPPTLLNPDVNGDGQLDILILGSSASIQDGGYAFAPGGVASELGNILSADVELGLTINVASEDIYKTKQLVTGYGQGGDEYDWTYHCHSMAQHYFWPEGRDERLTNLEGLSGTDWDHVIIAPDPTLLAEVPGYVSLGVNKLASRVSAGDAMTHLLLVWPRGAKADEFAHAEEFSYRIADGAGVDINVIPAGLAWRDRPDANGGNEFVHPSTLGATLSAASIYTALVGQSASKAYELVDAQLAESVESTLTAEANKEHYTGPRSFMSPFLGADISDRILNYNHTGTSSENGILKGLKWVLERAKVKLQKNGEPPINFNYGRANTEFEAHKRYKIDPAQFDVSLGFPMQDHSNHGNTTMFYGLDKRRNSVENGTDLGVARKMVRDFELPYGRTIPIRTLLAELKETIADQSAYSDGWHMHGNLDKASGAFMYTLLTGHCALGDEPENKESNDWQAWVAHKTGYETAWRLMHLRGSAPCFRVMPDDSEAVAVTLNNEAALHISFASPPNSNVTVTLSTDNDDAVSYAPKELVFTPENFNVPQTVTMIGLDGELSTEEYTISATTQSEDASFAGLGDRWTYTVNR